MKWVKCAMSAAALSSTYWLFAGQFTLTEVAAMVVALISAVALSILVNQIAEGAFEFRVPWARLGVQTATSLLRDSIRVGWFLLKSIWKRPPCPAGTLTCQKFRYGSESPREAARRALVVLAVSASPDRYITDVRHDDSFVAHALVGGASEADTEWPI